MSKYEEETKEIKPKQIHKVISSTSHFTREEQEDFFHMLPLSDEDKKELLKIFVEQDKKIKKDKKNIDLAEGLTEVKDAQSTGKES